MAFSSEQLLRLRGTYVIECIDPAGVTLTGYGTPTWTNGQTIDLLDTATADTLRAGSWGTARNMTHDPGCELTQLIAAGRVKLRPDLTVAGDPSVEQETPEG